MFLDIKGMTLPKWAMVHALTDDSNFEEWQGRKPYWVCPLEQTLWSEDIKKKITDTYKAVGVSDPMKQKLVEPYAGAFGGKNKEGACDFSEVNWGTLIDYFEWEAASISENKRKSEKLQKQAEKKYGGIFSHYLVYENYSKPR